MDIISIEKFVELSDHPLAMYAEAPYFADDILGCFVGPYKKSDSCPGGLRGTGVGIVEYHEIMLKLYPLLKDKYGAKIPDHSLGQTRFALKIESGGSAQIAIKKGEIDMSGGGFTICSPAKPAMEQLALLEPESLRVDDTPMNVGVLFVHSVDRLDPHSVRVWLLTEWKIAEGDDFIRCERCVDLGSIKFKNPPSNRESTGDTVDL